MCDKRAVSFSQSNAASSRGVTLLELLVTVVVLSVIVALAMPSMRDFVVGNRLSSSVNGFIGLANFARSEAIVRNQDVIICPKDASSNACVSTTAWNTYEIQAFVDVDADGAFSTGDILLKTLPAVDSANSQMGLDRSGTGILIFGSAGYARQAQLFKIYAITADSAYKARFGRTICVSKVGRIRVADYALTTCPDF
ncbi:GspH/FimT family protein [Variovorax robiniae]|uniref:Type II secretion system protein H n=1 Tax=Variovorax robiniae TaxID=1836199 RepID=A0ABU8XF37_9BURK